MRKEIKLKLAAHFKGHVDPKLSALVAQETAESFYKDFVENEAVLNLIEMQVSAGIKTVDQATKDAASYYLG